MDTDEKRYEFTVRQPICVGVRNGMADEIHPGETVRLTKDEAMPLLDRKIIDPSDEFKELLEGEEESRRQQWRERYRAATEKTDVAFQVYAIVYLEYNGIEVLDVYVSRELAEDELANSLLYPQGSDRDYIEIMELDVRTYKSEPPTTTTHRATHLDS